MALINCPECGKQVSDTAPACPHCGYPIIEDGEPAESVGPNKQKKNNLLGWGGIILAIFIVWAIAKTCGSDAENSYENTPADTSSITTNEVSKEDKQEEIKIYDKYNYKIVNIQPFKPYKCVFHIRLQEQLKEDQLKKIAQQIRADYPPYKRLLIFYLLPGMEISDGAWATSHYDTELEIKIIGVTAEEEEKPKKEVASSPNIVGKWYCNTPGVKHTMTIYKDGNRLKAKVVFPFGEKNETLRESKNGRYVIIGNKFGEYYILKSSGILELWDRDGKFATARKM